MDKKSFVSEQIKNWYVLDNILIECEPSKCIKKGKLFKEYCSLKTSFLMTLHEFYLYKQIKTIKGKVKDSKILKEQAENYAKHVKKVSVLMSSKKEIKDRITEKVIMESKKVKNKDLKYLSKLLVEKDFLTLAMDNAFIGIPLLENNIEVLPDVDDFKGYITYEAYKIQRDALVNLAMKVRHDYRAC